MNEDPRLFFRKRKKLKKYTLYTVDRVTSSSGWISEGSINHDVRQ